MVVIQKATVGGPLEVNNLETDGLFSYQRRSVNWLKNKRTAILALEMGLGKTVIAIKAFDEGCGEAILGQSSTSANTALVICPSIARPNWLNEFKMWSQVKRNYTVTKNLSDPIPPNTTAICSFDYASHNLEKLKALPWHTIIIDEAHFLKSPTAKRTKSIMGKNGLAHIARNTWLLTGTPAPNHPGELWVPLYTFGVTKLSYSDFIERYCYVRQTPHGIHISGTRRNMIPEIKTLISKVTLRYLKKDVMPELPPITHVNVIVEPGPVKVDELASFTKYFVPTDRRDELKEELEMQAAMLRLVHDNMKPGDTNKQVALASLQNSVSTLRRYIGLQKVEPTVQYIKNWFTKHPDRKLVVFALHRDVIVELQLRLAEFKPVTVFGQTDPDRRQRYIKRFKQSSKCKIFIANIHAAGTAITLTEAFDVLFVELDWVPGSNAQAIMRVHRIGQKNPVNVRYVMIKDTIDSKIAFLLKNKIRDLTDIFDK